MEVKVVIFELVVCYQTLTNTILKRIFVINGFTVVQILLRYPIHYNVPYTHIVPDTWFTGDNILYITNNVNLIYMCILYRVKTETSGRLSSFSSPSYSLQSTVYSIL